MVENLLEFRGGGSALTRPQERLAARVNRNQRRRRVGQFIRSAGPKKLDSAVGVAGMEFDFSPNRGKPVIMDQRAQRKLSIQLVCQLARLTSIACARKRHRG